MATDLYVSKELQVTRYAGPSLEGPDRRRYQFTIYGQTDNCGVRHAWVAIRHDDLQRLVAALQVEARRKE